MHITKNSAKPDTVKTEDMLEELLSEPTDGVVESLSKLDGDIIILGAAGKMGPTLSRMAKRASDVAGVKRRVIAVSRFSLPGQEDKLQHFDIKTIKCDLLDAEQVAALPDAMNVVFMAGMKFGATGLEPLTWAMNTYLPAVVCQKYQKSRIAAFSTGNIYGLTPATHGGSKESDDPNPIGEYAMSCLGRERMFQYFSQAYQTQVSLLRLNYAVELRYGVLVDIAQKVFNEQPVDVTMGCANIIWQGDANAMALQSLGQASSPAFILNLAGPETISIRRTAEQFAAIWGKTAIFSGEESKDALLSSGQVGHKLFGYPRVSPGQMIDWIADWISHGKGNLGKPTHFETRDGKF